MTLKRHILPLVLENMIAAESLGLLLFVVHVSNFNILRDYNELLNYNEVHLVKDKHK